MKSGMENGKKETRKEARDHGDCKVIAELANCLKRKVTDCQEGLR